MFIDTQPIASSPEDILLAGLARNALAVHVSTSYSAITVTADQGVVTLHGSIENEEQRRAALESVSCVAGVQGITDALRLWDCASDASAMPEDAFPATPA